ncbi:NRDE family protein [Salinispirillum sp. LH 10-3-1]|uniref:NRDE family protein n=1 Tax=Salinispirillum sp. LH 10-3-1 TaxID=2952525 RepID=A0AB38YFX2_9GAMM
MCLITFAYQQHDDYPLLLAANRDEFYARPTRALDYWPDQPSLLAGKDLQAGGTWMGVIARGPNTGRFAALTNIRQLPAPDIKAPSRGELVTKVLLTAQSIPECLKAIELRGHQYQGFNLVAGDASGIWYLSNRVPGVRALDPGVYSLSNGTLDEPWPKTTLAHQQLKDFMAEPSSVRDLALLLSSRSRAPDEALPRTGIALDWERALSAQWIDIPEYGTRAQTGFLVTAQGEAQLYEQTLLPGPGTPLPAGQQFRLPGFW